MISIGIDPGLSGAIAFIPDAGEPRVVDMPVAAYSEGAVKNAVNLAGVAAHLRPYLAVLLEQGDVRVMIERVNAMPSIPGKNGQRRSMGSSSAFSLGMSYWGVAGVVTALGLPLTIVTPNEWKKFFKLGADKDMARGLAARLFPTAPLHAKKHHGRAEALLIAQYARNR